MKRIWLKRFAIVFSLSSVIASVGVYWAVQQTRQVPEFYSRASTQVPLQSAEASRQLEAEVHQLQTQAGRIGMWRASFSDQEINAWLIEELPKKFPRLLALGASEPRIVIEDDRVLAAVRYKNQHIDTVVSCELQVELTEEPNMLAFRVENLRAGALPLPIGNFRRGISREAARGDVDIRWDLNHAGPIALVTVPSEDPRYVLGPVVVESVVLVEGQLLLSGHTGKLAHETYRPRGPVYQFVLFEPGRQRTAQSHPSLDSKSRGGTTIR